MKRKPNWNATNLAKLRRDYPTKNTAQLADELGIDIQSVRWRASLMGLRKDTTGQQKTRREFLDGVIAEYATSTAREIAERRGVSVPCVRMWIREARYGGSYVARTAVTEAA